jgi:hypothetical protein
MQNSLSWCAGSASFAHTSGKIAAALRGLRDPMPIASHPKFVIHDHRQTLLHSSTPYNHSFLFFDGMLFQSHLTRVRLGLKTIIIIIIIIINYFNL